MNDVYSILKDVDKYLSNIVQNNKLWAEQAALITATLENHSQVLGSNIDYQIRNKKKETIRSLCIISWYLPDEIRYYLQEKLKQIVGINVDLQEEYIILQGKPYLNLYLVKIIQEKGLFHLYGNILDKTKFQFSVFQLKLRIRQNNKGPKIPEKRFIGVGYKDKGCLPEKHVTGLSKIDYKLTQLKIEQQRESNESYLLFLKGFLE